MINYYVKTFRGNLICSPEYIEDNDPKILQYNMLPCSNYDQFDPLTKKIKSRSIVNNEVVYVFEDRIVNESELGLERISRKKELQKELNSMHCQGYDTGLGFTICCMENNLVYLKGLMLVIEKNNLTEINVDDIDGNINLVTKEQLEQIVLEIFTKCNQMKTKRSALFTMIDNATTIQEIRSINWNTEI